MPASGTPYRKSIAKLFMPCTLPMAAARLYNSCALARSLATPSPLLCKKPMALSARACPSSAAARYSASVSANRLSLYSA